jgi:hemin uptake protein HemP
MSQPPRATRPDDVVGETTDIVPTVLATDGPVDSATLMKGRRELIIRHGADTYRLRITASNKLILTK